MLIKITEKETILEGTTSDLLTGITLGISQIVEAISKETGTGEEQIIEDLMQGLQIKKLMDSGMEGKEALRVVTGKDME